MRYCLLIFLVAFFIKSLDAQIVKIRASEEHMLDYLLSNQVDSAMLCAEKMSIEEGHPSILSARIGLKMSYDANNEKLGLYFLKGLIFRGENIERIISENTDSFKHSLFWKNISKDIDDYELNYKCNLNHKFCFRISQLSEVDQLTRTIVPDFPESLFLDSVYVFNEFYSLITNTAFSLDDIGEYTNDMYLIFYHQTRYENNFLKLKPILDRLLYDGIFSPREYANIIDEYLFVKTGKQRYGTKSEFNKLIRFEEGINVEDARRNIGLPILKKDYFLRKKNIKTEK